MKRAKFLQCLAAGVSGIGLLLPSTVVSAANRKPAALACSAAAIADVALLADGVLQGQVVDAHGRPLAETVVSLQFENHEVAIGRTNARGFFAVRGLRGGTYEITAGGSSGVYRLWAPSTAPPAAGAGALIVTGRAIEPGQYFGGESGPRLLMVGVMGGMVAAGVIAAGTDRVGS